MRDPIFLRTGSYATLASLLAVWGATAAMAQDPPRRILRPIVVPVQAPAPAPAEEEVRVDTAEGSTPSPTPPRVPAQIRRVPTVGVTPAPVPATPRIRRTPVITSPAETEPTAEEVAPRRRVPVVVSPPETGPEPVRVAPRRRIPVITSPDGEVAPDADRLRRPPPVAATPPEREPTGPVRPRRVPPVITDPASDTDAAPEIRRRPPVITTPSAEDMGEVRRRPPVVTSPPPGELRRRPPVITTSDAPPNDDAPSPTFAAPPERRPLTPVRPRPGTKANILATEIIPPADGQTLPLAGSVTLRRGGFGDLIKTMPVVRQMSGAQLRANPMIKVGKSQLDFRKMLANPKALVNIADRLGEMPDLVDVRPGQLTAFEVGKGIVVRDFLSYSFKSGACSSERNRARIAATGISCFTRSPPADIDASYAKAGSLRFVRDPIKRAQALAEAKARRSQVGQDIDSQIAEFRSQLADPAMRAELVASVGDAEVARLEALDDTTLAGELINSSDNLIEQVFYVPVDAPPQEPATPAPPPPPKVEDVNASYPLGTHTYLAGFTLGRDFEWSQGVQTTIKWCLLGCKKTYYAKVSAGFGYKFGLRFPIQLSGTYDYALKNNAQSGSVTTQIVTINGSATDYAATKLPANLVYDGKELVASFSAHAGVAAKLPIVGQLGPIDIPLLDYDLTTLLPGDFANGQFKPPEPGVPGPSAPFILEQLDLLGGRGNFGVLGGQVFPAVDVRMDATLLTLSLTDKFAANKAPITLSSGTTTVPLALKNGASEFIIGNPQYGIQFTLTPGLNARLFIDLAVWGAKVDWPVWFPQLAVTVPSDALKFECHEGTVCSHEFRFTPNGAQSVFLGKVEQWGLDFENLYLPKCIDETCRFGVRLAQNTVIFEGKKKDADNPAGETNALYQSMTPFFIEATKRAKAYIAEAQARKSQAVSNAMGILAQAIWTKQCKDSLCFDNITALAAQMGPRAAQIANANPSLGTMKINQQVNKEFVPQFQKEVGDSELRESIAQAQLVAQQIKSGKQPKPIR
ncbi:hypothetical protein [Sphingopyxis sp.]|uniref:hypothetical protein n=1 Tax=Sphingopyxis sp. TaxID=1908224 RepID=UPI003BAB5524